MCTAQNNADCIIPDNVCAKYIATCAGKINVVIFTPDDINILKNGPMYRRRFLDIFIGQLRPNYIYCLNMYQKTLEQRNMYLKQIKFENKNQEMLDIWDLKLSEYGEKIYSFPPSVSLNKSSNAYFDSKEAFFLNTEF